MQKRLLALLMLFAFTQIKAQQKNWISLFDGKTTKGWHTYGKESVGEAWQVVDGALMLDPSHKEGWQIKGGGDIVSDESFGDFHLQLEWKISKDGNSGIIFFVQDEPKKYNYIWYTGPEMQVLDNDGHADGKIIKHRAGNLYDLVAGVEGAVKPVGEWNLVDIINEKGTLTLKLNGITTVTTTLGDDAWKNLIKNSKFSKGESPDFGKVFTGHIGLQDHGNQVWFRNIKIQKL
jgi:hypothetical protein